MGVFSILALCLFSVIFNSCAPSYVVARPVAPVYVRPAAPSRYHVWVNDDWVYRGGRYEYRHGYWAQPRSNRQWVEGNWQARSGRYYWTPGRWSRSRRY